MKCAEFRPAVSCCQHCLDNARRPLRVRLADKSFLAAEIGVIEGIDTTGEKVFAGIAGTLAIPYPTPASTAGRVHLIGKGGISGYIPENIVITVHRKQIIFTRSAAIRHR